MCIDDTVKKDRYVFFNGVKNHLSHDVAQSLDANISEDVVEHVISHLANDKSVGWDGLTNEIFKKYVLKLKGPFMVLFSKGVDSRGNASFLEDSFDKAFAEGAFSIFLCSWETYFIDGGKCIRFLQK